MRVVGVINDQWATKSVAILQLVMGMVPIGSRLIFSVEPILKVLARLNRALSYERDAISPVGSVLEYSVPMLQTKTPQRSGHKENIERTHDRSRQVHGGVIQVVDDVDREITALLSHMSSFND